MVVVRVALLLLSLLCASGVTGQGASSRDRLQTLHRAREAKARLVGAKRLRFVEQAVRLLHLLSIQ